MSEPNLFYGTPELLERKRAELAQRLEDMAKAVRIMPAERLREMLYSLESALDRPAVMLLLPRRDT